LDRSFLEELPSGGVSLCPFLRRYGGLVKVVPSADFLCSLFEALRRTGPFYRQYRRRSSFAFFLRRCGGLVLSRRSSVGIFSSSFFCTLGAHGGISIFQALPMRSLCFLGSLPALLSVQRACKIIFEFSLDLIVDLRF
jgi:hypothetical protein